MFLIFYTNFVLHQNFWFFYTFFYTKNFAVSTPIFLHQILKFRKIFFLEKIGVKKAKNWCKKGTPKNYNMFIPGGQTSIFSSGNIEDFNNKYNCKYLPLEINI